MILAEAVEQGEFAIFMGFLIASIGIGVGAVINSEYPFVLLTPDAIRKKEGLRTVLKSLPSDALELLFYLPSVLMVAGGIGIVVYVFMSG